MNWRWLLIAGLIAGLAQSQLNRFAWPFLNLSLLFLFLVSISSEKNYSFWFFWFSLLMIAFEGFMGFLMAFFGWLALFVFEILKKKLGFTLGFLLGGWLAIAVVASIPLFLFFYSEPIPIAESVLLTFGFGGLAILVFKIFKRDPYERRRF